MCLLLEINTYLSAELTNKNKVLDTICCLQGPQVISSELACSRLSVSGYDRKSGRARVGSGREKGGVIFSPVFPSLLVPLVPRPRFPSPLTKSIEKDYFSVK